MAAPTFVSQGASAFNTATTPKTLSIAVNAGDTVVVYGVTDNNLTTVGTPSDGVNTWSQIIAPVVVTDFCWVGAWSTTAATTTTLTVSCARGGTGGDHWGIGYYVHRSSGGIGASSKTNVTSGAPSLALTTTGANSAVINIVGDWNAVDGASRVWRTINSITPSSGAGTEGLYLLDTGLATIYSARWTDVGAAGSKTTGLSAPTGQKYSIIAIEVLGSASSNVSASDAPSGARQGGSSATGAVSVLYADIPSGGREGSSPATGSVSVVTTDTPNGIRNGNSSVTVTSDVITSDTASGARLGFSTSSALSNVQVSDTSKGIRQGESSVSLVFDVLATDSPVGFREGQSSVSSSFLTPLVFADSPTGARLGTSGETVTFDLFSQDLPEGSRLGASEESVSSGLTVQDLPEGSRLGGSPASADIGSISDQSEPDISMGIRLGESSAQAVISAPLSVVPTLHVSVGQRLFVRLVNDPLQASVGISLRSVITEP